MVGKSDIIRLYVIIILKEEEYDHQINFVLSIQYLIILNI